MGLCPADGSLTAPGAAEPIVLGGLPDPGLVDDDPPEEAIIDPVAENKSGLDSSDIKHLTPAYLDRLNFTPFSHGLKVTDEARDVLGLSDKDTQEIDSIMTLLSEEVATLELDNLEVEEQSPQRTTIVVKAFRAEGAQLLRIAQGSILDLLGPESGRILLDKSWAGVKKQLRDVGYYEQKFVFLPNSKNGYVARRFTAGGWQEIFPGGRTTIPEKYKHLFTWEEEKAGETLEAQ